MPINRYSGFTLVEILVVLFIMGITFGMAMLAVGDFGATRKIRNAAEGFAEFVQVAHEHAIIESATLQVTLQASGYTCLHLNTKNRWQALKNRFYQPRKFPTKTRVTMMYGSKKADQMAIIISSTGDMSPFKVMFSTADKSNVASVVGKEDGTVIYKAY